MNKKTENKVSLLVQEKLYFVHTSILNYMRDMRDEEKLYELQDVIEESNVILPESIYKVIREFVFHYLERELFDMPSGKAPKNDLIDWKKYEALEIQCQDWNAGEDYIYQCKLKTMYDAIAMDYIRPLFYS